MTDITAILPVHNGMPYLVDAVRSILDQRGIEFALVIVDDGSTDGSLEYAKSITDNRVRVLAKRQGGKGSAMNLALKSVQSPYWVIQDADDISHPERLAVLTREFEADTTVGLLYTGWQFLTPRATFAPTWLPRAKSECRRSVDRLAPPGHDATMAFRTVATQDLCFDEELFVGQGLDFAFQVAETWDCAVAPGCLLTYRVHARSTTARNSDRIDKAHRRIVARAAQRRGVSIQSLPEPRPHQGGRLSTDLVPHTIESVRDHLAVGQRAAALRHAALCAAHERLSLRQYKALVFAALPNSVINGYRRLRQR